MKLDHTLGKFNDDKQHAGSDISSLEPDVG